MSKARTATKPKRRGQGLLDLFGHTYVPDPEGTDGALVIQYQFKIIRGMKGDRYVVQYFSFWDGTPTNVGVMTEAELLGPTVKLYATAELWNVGYEKEAARRSSRRRTLEQMRLEHEERVEY